MFSLHDQASHTYAIARPTVNETTPLGASDFVQAASLSPNDQWLVTRQASGGLKLWDVRRCLPKFEIHYGDFVPITALENPNGSQVLLLGGGREPFAQLIGNIRPVLYDLEHPDTPKYLDVKTHDVLVSWAPKGDRLFLTSQPDGTVFLFDTKSGKMLRSIPGSQPQSVAPTFIGTGDLAAVANGSTEYVIYDLKSGHALRNVVTNGRELSRLFASPNEDRIIAVYKTGDIEAKDAHSGISLWKLDFNAEFTQEDDLRFVEEPPGGKHLVAFSDKAVAAINVQTGKVDWRIATNDPSIDLFCVSANGRYVATARFGGFIKIWDVKNGRLAASFSIGGGISRTLKFTPDGEFLVSASDEGGIRIWEVRSGKLLKVYSGQLALITKNGNELITVGGGAAKVFPVAYMSVFDSNSH